jgi:hypothetical protein
MRMEQMQHFWHLITFVCLQFMQQPIDSSIDVI